MPTCRICKHTFKTLKFQTEHIEICTRCVNTLNESPEPASAAQARLAEMLARGMRRNAERDMVSDEEWKRRKAQWTIDNFDFALEQALPNWITKLLANPDNSTRDFKIMRAHRRGLLRMNGFSGYPVNWTEVASNIRARDGARCLSCGAMDLILDVHHIVYLSKHGTNQQHNLITLCRLCHQAEHSRVFDWPEAKDPESISPIQPSPEATPPDPEICTPTKPPAHFESADSQATKNAQQRPSKIQATPAHWEAAREQLRPAQAGAGQPAPQPAAAEIHNPTPAPQQVEMARSASGNRERSDLLDAGLILGAIVIAVIGALIFVAIQQ